MPSTVDTRIYWAAEPDASTLVERINSKFGAYIDRITKCGRMERASQTLSAYYGRGVDGARTTATVQAGGEQGEIALHSVNAIRPLVTQVLSLIAGQRPGMKPVATNTDGDSVAQAILADGLRGYYERTLDMPGVELDVVRGGLLASSWWLVQGWRPSLGDEVAVDPDTGKTVFEGNVELLSCPMWRVATDATARRDVDRKWIIFRTPASRHALAADYPEMKDKLLSYADMAQSAGGDWGQRLVTNSDATGLDLLFGDFLEDDAVWLWEMRHLPSAALPKGRLVRYVSGDCVLYDSDAQGYPYEELHAYEWTPERIAGATQGHTGAFDLLACQEMLDVVTTACATVANVCGMPHFWTMDPGGLNPTQLNSGPTVLGGAVKPEVLEFPALKPELLTYGEFLRTFMREGFALNNVVMGQPDKGMPAQAMALLRAQAVQYNGPAQGAYVRLVEQNTTGVLRLNKRFARAKRVAEIAGKSGAWEMKTWAAPDIAGVARFACEAIDPMTRTPEARLSLADSLAQHGWTSKQGYLATYLTGDVKEPLEAETLQLELLTRNKDLLRQGTGLAPVNMQASLDSGQPVFIDDGQPHVRLAKTDPHWITFKEYASVLASPESRENPAVVAAVTSVLVETLRLWGTLSPDELAALGGPPLPSQMGMGATPPPGPGAGPSGTPPPDKGEGSSTPAPAPGQPSGAPSMNLPKPPENPLTGGHEGAASLQLSQTSAAPS